MFPRGLFPPEVYRHSHRSQSLRFLTHQESSFRSCRLYLNLPLIPPLSTTGTPPDTRSLFFLDQRAPEVFRSQPSESTFLFFIRPLSMQDASVVIYTFISPHRQHCGCPYFRSSLRPLRVPLCPIISSLTQPVASRHPTSRKFPYDFPSPRLDPHPFSMSS